MSTMFIIRGVSGSGKSSLAELLSAALNCNYWEADSYFMQGGKYVFNPLELKAAHEWCYWQVSRDVRCGEPVIVSNTFTREEDIQEYLDLANDFGYEVFSLVVENRHGGVSVHGVPSFKLASQEDLLRANLKLR